MRGGLMHASLTAASDAAAQGRAVHTALLLLFRAVDTRTAAAVTLTQLRSFAEAGAGGRLRSLCQLLLEDDCFVTAMQRCAIAWLSR
jgi:hypothetical protein